MHLKIEQNTGTIEEVNGAILSKLYNISNPEMGGNLDENSDLIGRINSSYGYDNEVTYLQNRFQNLYINVNKRYIKFEDPEVEKICKINFSSDGTGCTTQDLNNVSTISTNPAASAKSSYFTGNTVIENFDEFEKFTNPNFTVLPINSFQGCSNLKSIKMPNNIVDIQKGQIANDGVFANCTQLTDVKLSENLSIIGKGSFQNCSSLQSINIPASIKKIDANAFSNCTSLTSVILNDGLKAISYGAFFECPLSQLIIPKSVTTIGNIYLFSGDSTLELVIFEDGNEDDTLTIDIYSGGFANGFLKSCKNGCKVIFPNKNIILNNQALSTNRNCTFEFKTQTPPVWNNPAHYGNGTTTIIVPDGAKEAYLNAPGFSTFTTQYKVIKEKSETT